MRKLVAAVLAALLSASTTAWADVTDTPKRTMPHQEKCPTLLPAEFWDDSAARRFHSSEAWAWNERICLGQRADMRYAPGGSGSEETCQPEEIGKKGAPVPAHRELRPEFLELVLSHEPWSSTPRHPQVVVRCALVRGDIDLDDHEIAPTFGFHRGKIDGDVSLLGTRFKRSLSLRGSTVTGRIAADRMEVGGGLFLRDGGRFANLDLRGARMAGNVEISGSTVSGLLNGDGLKVGGTLFLHGGSTFADIDLVGARIAEDVALNGSTVTGMLSADGMEVEGTLFLRDGGTFGGIRLLGARVSHNVEFNGSTVIGRLNADGLEVGGTLFLRDGGNFADIDLLGARIARNVEFDTSTVTGLLNADRLEVGGGLFLRDGGRFAGIYLHNARIAANAEISGSTVAGRLNAPGVEVEGSLYLRGGTFADISLLAAKIGRDVQLSGSGFTGALDLTGAMIGGELHLSSGWLENSPNWRNGASLILRNVEVDVLQARKDSWNISGVDGLLPTELTGFKFNRLGGLDTSGSASMGDESADWLVDWIEAQRDHGSSYDPQPYTQMAHVLEAAGASDKAKAILYAKFKHKHVHDKSLNALDRAVLTLERYFWGYRLYPLQVLCWFAGLVALGVLLAQFSKDSSVRRWMSLWYSLENAVPIIETNERFKNVEHGRPCLRHFFHCQKAVGFVLATVLVGMLALSNG